MGAPGGIAMRQISGRSECVTLKRSPRNCAVVVVVVLAVAVAMTSAGLHSDRLLRTPNCAFFKLCRIHTENVTFSELTQSVRSVWFH